MQAQPYTFRDMRRGVQRKYSLANSLAPENSVSHSLNVNFDTVIGSAVVRSGTTKLGNTVASNKTPLGLYNFVGTGGSPNLVIAVYSGASNASIYYYDSSWHTSGVTTLNNSAKNRFASIGGRVFRVSSGDAMSSSVDGNTWNTTNCITTASLYPTLLMRSGGRLLASGYSGFKDRVYFSSVIDPNASPTLTWNTDQSTGDFIDINPDDGSNVTGFAETSGVVLVFKDKGLYRMNVISKTVDYQNIFNMGSPSQEAITVCQGVVYFFSGQDIRRTVGDYPEQISRLGVQDFIDAIPQSNWGNVCAGNDGVNVYFSIGNVTLNTNKNEQVTYNNVVLKYSTRDESWSVHSYAQSFRYFSPFITSAGVTTVVADTSGNVQTINSGTTDNTSPIFYELETNELEFGRKETTKKISDKVVVFTNYGIDSSFQVKSDTMLDYKGIDINLSKRVNVSRGMPSVEGHSFTFRWFGNSSGTAPIFEGFMVPNVTDQGIIYG